MGRDGASSESTRTASIFAWLRDHRKRLAPLVLAVFVFIVGMKVFGAAPRETAILVRLGPEHESVTEVRVGYFHDSEEVAFATFRYEGGAPPSVRHELDLSPGRYDVHIDVTIGGRAHTFVRALDVPAEGEVRLDAFDQALAGGFRMRGRS